MWFVGSSRTDGAAYADSVAARLNIAECEAEEYQNRLAELDRAHRDLEERVMRLENELTAARQDRLEAFTRWWNCREDRDRARHIARRLRRRLDRAARRELRTRRAGEEPSTG